MGAVTSSENALPNQDKHQHYFISFPGRLGCEPAPENTAATEHTIKPLRSQPNIQRRSIRQCKSEGKQLTISNSTGL